MNKSDSYISWLQMSFISEYPRCCNRNFVLHFPKHLPKPPNRCCLQMDTSARLFLQKGSAVLTCRGHRVLNVYGIDFTSRPSRRKPLTCLRCIFENGVLTAQELQEWSSYQQFETALQQPGPWIMGVDFPFGQSAQFIKNIAWPLSWSSYVEHAASLGRVGFRDALTNYRIARPYGDREHRRKTDIAASSISPQKLYGVPVALMFFEGAQRLVKSGVSIPLLQEGDPNRLVVEAYPGVLARRIIGKRSYKNDAVKRQTDELFAARVDMLSYILSGNAETGFGFKVAAPMSLADDASGDQLDALLCAMQAAWAWTMRNEDYGAPHDADLLEGWIADPMLRVQPADVSSSGSTSAT